MAVYLPLGGQGPAVGAGWPGQAGPSYARLPGAPISQKTESWLGRTLEKRRFRWLSASPPAVGTAVDLGDEHVRVDIIYRNASNNYKRKIDTLGIIFFLIPLVILIGYFSINFVSSSWMVQEASTEPGGLPFVYLQKTIILLFPIVLFFASIEKLMQLWK